MVEETPTHGQRAPARPGFESKSEVVEARGEAPAGAAVNRGAEKVDRAANVVYYRYKGVDLPLKKFVEYQGSQPFVRIIDGNDVLWVAKRGDLYRMLDRVLYQQLDSMTGAADDLYERHRFASAYQAYRDVMRVLTNDANDLTSADLEHYPAVRSYLQLRMGQARGWESHNRWRDAEAHYKRADDAEAEARDRRDDPEKKHLADLFDTMAGEHRGEGEKAVANARALGEEARALLESAASANDRLWQASNELGILAASRANRLASEGDAEGSEKELRNAVEHFKKARAGDAKETIDQNLMAVYSSLADVEHARGRYGEALDLLREAMEIAPEVATENSLGYSPGYEVAFTRFHPIRGETIVVTAELQSGIARKYLSIERDRRNAEANPPVAETEPAVIARWRDQGEALLEKKRWRSAVGFYTALHDEYKLAEETSSAPPDFRSHVQKSLERAIGERATALLEKDREEDALGVYKLALNYLPDSSVLNQAHVTQTSRKADRALASGKWEQALEHLQVVQTIYGAYAGKDPAKLRTKADVSLKLGAAYVGLTRAALDRGDTTKAGQWAELAMGLSPVRPEWKENKGRVLFETARLAERAGDKEGALALYEQARQVAVGPVKIRSSFSRDKVRAQLLLPKVRRRAIVATRDYGLLVVLGALGIVVGIPATRGAMSAAARRRRAKTLRSQAQSAYDKKEWHSAVDGFNEYLAAHAGAADPQAYELLARSYRKIGDYENALRYFERAAARLPGRRYNLERAEIYLAKRNLPLALQALRTSPNVADDAARLVNFLNYLREKDGESLFVTEALAQVQIAAGDFDAGRQLYLRLLDLDPRNTRTLRALAEIARRAGQAAERRGYLEKLVAIDRDDAPALRELGNLLATEGKLQHAIDALRRAMDITPGEGLAARIAELQAEFLVREAESEIARLSREGDTPSRRFRIGELHWRLGRGREAKPFFEEAATVKEYQARALRYLGLISHGEGNHEDAISLLRGYLAKRTNLAPDVAEKEARYVLAEAYEKTGNADQAAAQYDAIFEADPGYKDVSRRVKQRLAKNLQTKGPQDCPFCHKRVPGDAEFCPHCNFHLTSGGAGKYEATPTSITMPGAGARMGLPEKLDEPTITKPGSDEDPGT